jgi:hypothetical protein
MRPVGPSLPLAPRWRKESKAHGALNRQSKGDWLEPLRDMETALRLLSEPGAPTRIGREIDPANCSLETFLAVARFSMCASLAVRSTKCWAVYRRSSKRELAPLWDAKVNSDWGSVTEALWRNKTMATSARSSP